MSLESWGIVTYLDYNANGGDPNCIAANANDYQILEMFGRNGSFKHIKTHVVIK